MSERIVITGWGQITQPKDARAPFMEPLDMMEQAARAAAAIAGPGVLAGIDALLVVRTQSRALSDPVGDLARRLGVTPKITRVSGIGGESPQHFVNQAAGLLARGDATTVLICGAETYYPRTQDAVTGENALTQGITNDYEADDAVGSSALEQQHGVSLPIHGFPLFETALWAESGLDRAGWLAEVGGMWSRFSTVAATHPNAWTRSPWSAEEIVTPSAQNRPIAFPYTKRMVSLVMADLGAAIVLTTERHAQRLRSSASPVYFLGGAYAKDRQRFLADKARFTRSPALAAAAAKATTRAGISVAEIEGFDLYSCFPCAVSVAKRELGIANNDPRALTTTGGLGFFGGPGSNFALHGIATMAEAIANGRYRTGLTTALGWFMHKYAVGIYGATPNATDFSNADREDDALPLAGDPPIAQADAVAGVGTIETYTVIFARDQTPACGVIYGRTTAGLRFVANSPHEAATYTALMAENQIGRPVRLTTDRTTQLNLAILA